MRVVFVPSLRRQGPSAQEAHGSREQRPASCGIYEFSDACSSGFMSSEDEFRLRLCWGQRPWRGLWTCWTVCKVRSHPWQGKDDQQMSRYFDLFFFNVKWCNTTFCWNIYSYRPSTYDRLVDLFIMIFVSCTWMDVWWPDWYVGSIDMCWNGIWSFMCLFS